MIFSNERNVNNILEASQHKLLVIIVLLKLLVLQPLKLLVLQPIEAVGAAAFEAVRAAGFEAVGAAAFATNSISLRRCFSFLWIPEVSYSDVLLNLLLIKYN